MGEILSFPGAGRKTEQAQALAAQWQDVLADNQERLLSRTIRTINALPTPSLLAAYRFTEQLNHNRKKECRCLESLMEALFNLDSEEIVELGKVAGLLQQGYVINWHGARMEFNQGKATL